MACSRSHSPKGVCRGASPGGGLQPNSCSPKAKRDILPPRKLRRILSPTPRAPCQHWARNKEHRRHRHETFTVLPQAEPFAPQGRRSCYYTVWSVQAGEASQGLCFFFNFLSRASANICREEGVCPSPAPTVTAGGRSHPFSHPLNKSQESHHSIPVAPISKIPRCKCGHTHVHKSPSGKQRPPSTQSVLVGSGEPPALPFSAVRPWSKPFHLTEPQFLHL